jgi:SEL1 protein
VEDETIVESANQLSPEEIQHQQEILEADLSMAAHYYKEGAEKHRSPRANFNLGFMYEFGLGLKQDFPLAKRHYDLARTMSTRGEAEVAVQIALWVMSVHEYIVKWKLSWEDRQRRQSRPPSNASHPHRVGRTTQDVILSHIFNWSSLLIAVLLYVFVQLQKARGQRRRT